VKRHIRLLHEYNEIKDVAQGLMGLIAEARGVRQVDVQREYGVKEQD
jgi:DNA repair protein Swi5/Sae3